MRRSTSDWDAERAEKGGYEHFMLKEIHEQPAVIAETVAGRVADDGSVGLEGVHFDDDFATGIDKIWITACGTAYHAGLVGREIFAGLLRVPTSVEYAHEMRYADPIVRSRQPDRRHQPVGRDRGHPRRCPAGPRARLTAPRAHQCRGEHAQP